MNYEFDQKTRILSLKKNELNIPQYDKALTNKNVTRLLLDSLGDKEKVFSEFIWYDLPREVDIK